MSRIQKGLIATVKKKKRERSIARLGLARSMNCKDLVEKVASRETVARQLRHKSNISCTRQNSENERIVVKRHRKFLLPSSSVIFYFRIFVECSFTVFFFFFLLD